MQTLGSRGAEGLEGWFKVTIEDKLLLVSRLAIAAPEAVDSAANMIKVFDS